jgi:hypothetical protein
MPLPVIIGLQAVIVAVTDEVPRILTVRRAGHELAGDGPAGLDALTSGPLDPERDRTLELGVRRWAREQAGIELGYVEQLYTFGDAERDTDAAARALSVAYLALVRQSRTAGTDDAGWADWYGYLPWEDWREGRPAMLDAAIAPALAAWADDGGSPGGRQLRRDRAEIAFGLSGAGWDPVRVLERYELLWEAGLVPEARRRPGRPRGDGPELGRPMALDHRRIAATALGRLRGKLTYRPVVFELLPVEFTLLQLQRVVESLTGARLHKQNFRRLVEHGGLVEGTGAVTASARGRPAELFRFRPEVLRERPAPGLGLPGRRAADAAFSG